MSSYDDMRYEQDVNREEIEKEVFKSSPDLYGKKIKATPKPPLEIGIDRKDSFVNNILEQGDSSQLDISKINSFLQISQQREVIYDLLDTMGDDPMIASALEIYTEDVTETNDRGAIVWCEADDPNIAAMVTYLLDSMNVDKNIYTWAYSLIKYGDLYLRLYRKSDFEEADLFHVNKEKNVRKPLTEDVQPESDKPLNEDVYLQLYRENDPYEHYIEMVADPATMFELTKFGKTFAYIEADTAVQISKENVYMNNNYKYSFRSGDVKLYQPTTFVHACLSDGTNRSPETVDLFTPQISLNSSEEAKYSFNVRRGQSALYTVFKIWREMTLLENSMLLNRVTTSSMVRLLNIEVGDMPPEDIGPHLANIKRLFEQKMALNVGSSLEEYTNPGPVENYIYIPTHDGLGAISTQEFGGAQDVSGLADVDYFKDKLSGALKIPKQYLGFTDDSTGFNGGTALSLVSSRYAKAVKRIQNQLLQAMTDIVNLMLIDKHMDNYINKFTLRMQEPTTQEEMDRKDSKSTSVGIAQDILSLVGDMKKESSKLKVLKILIPTIVSDSDIVDIIQDEIDAALAEEEVVGAAEGEEDDFDMGGNMHISGGRGPSEPPVGPEGGGEEFGAEEGGAPEGDEEEAGPAATNLPTPDELGAGDFTDNNIEF